MMMMMMMMMMCQHNQEHQKDREEQWEACGRDSLTLTHQSSEFLVLSYSYHKQSLAASRASTKKTSAGSARKTTNKLKQHHEFMSNERKDKQNHQEPSEWTVNVSDGLAACRRKNRQFACSVLSGLQLYHTKMKDYHIEMCLSSRDSVQQRAERYRAREIWGEVWPYKDKIPVEGSLHTGLSNRTNQQSGFIFVLEMQYLIQ
jgi:hypothetical protein